MITGSEDDDGTSLNRQLDVADAKRKLKQDSPQEETS